MCLDYFAWKLCTAKGPYIRVDDQIILFYSADREKIVTTLQCQSYGRELCVFYAIVMHKWRQEQYLQEKKTKKIVAKQAPKENNVNLPGCSKET